MTGSQRSSLLDLLAEAERSGDRERLPSYASSAEEIEAFAKAHALDCGFVHLVTALALGEPGYWRQAIEALPPAADNSLVTARWIEWLWSNPACGMRRLVENEKLLASGDAICSLHRRACSRTEIPRGEWRKARASVMHVEGAGPVEAAAASVVAAAAWDPASVPGAAADTIYAWRMALFARVDRDLDWNAEKQQAADERRDRMAAAGHAAAEAALAAAQPGASPGERPAALDASSPLYQQAYARGVADFVAGNPSDLDRRGEETQAANEQVYRLARAGFLQVVAALAEVPRATAETHCP